MPPRYRDPLVLCCLEGLTQDEAAGRLGVGVETLRSRLKRGRKKLADALSGPRVRAGHRPAGRRRLRRGRRRRGS